MILSNLPFLYSSLVLIVICCLVGLTSFAKVHAVNNHLVYDRKDPGLEEYIVTIIWEGDRYDIPYTVIKDRLKGLAWVGNSKYGRRKRISFSKKFLKNYLVPKVKPKTN